MDPVKMSELRAEFPDLAHVPDDQFLIGLRQELFPHVKPAEFYGAIDHDTHREQLAKEQLGEMSTGAKYAANLGAGTEDLIQGIDQLRGKATEADVAESRKFNAPLAASVPGGGATQFAGSVLPTMALPASMLVRGAAYGPRAWQALRGTGEAAKAAGKLVQGARAGGALAPATLAESTGMGMGYGAIQPVGEGESRGDNTFWGGVGGVVAPVALSGVGQGLKSAWRYMTGSGLPSEAAAQLAGNAGGPAAQVAGAAGRNAPGQIGQAVTAEAADALRRRFAQYRAPTVRGREVDVPVTAAEASGDPHLAQLEAAARRDPVTAPSWHARQAEKNAAQFGVLEDIVPSDLRIQRLEAVREGRTAPMRQQALAAANSVPDVHAPVVSHAEQLLASEASADPAVARVAQYVQRELGEGAAGPPTPERLYRIRKVLSDKLGGRVDPNDELGSAARSARRDTMGIINAIDDQLDAATGGQWRPYVSEYSQRSGPVSSGHALQAVMGQMETKPYIGGTPEMTYHGLRGAVRQHGVGKYGERFTPAAQRDVANLLEHLRSTEAVARTRKKAATMGGGAITASDNALRGWAQRGLDALPGVGAAVRYTRNANQGDVNLMLNEALQTPGGVQKMLNAAPRQARPNMLTRPIGGPAGRSTRDEMLVRALRASGMGVEDLTED